ncbi:MAG: hypothetical protein ACLUNQ_08130 [Oscillospiraceae bacterium]
MPANVGYYVPAKAVVDGAEVVAPSTVNGRGTGHRRLKSGAPSIFNVVSTAGGQMFFSLSLGMGAMITYGSYLHKKENTAEERPAHRYHAIPSWP